MPETKHVIIISDGTGQTAQRLMDAVFSHFYGEDINFDLARVYQQVRTKETIDKTLDEIFDDYLVLFSIVSEELADYLTKALVRRKIMHLNVLRPMIDVTTRFLGVHPDYVPGRLQMVNDRYYEKTDAIGYAVSHDDGLGNRINEADLVLLGISRTCKTPISMYLACNHGLRVANIPIVNDEFMAQQVVKRLESVSKDRIVGLLMQPDTLATIRESRSTLLTRAGHNSYLSSYYDIRKVAEEYRFSRQFFEENGWTTADVTRRAIEEIAVELLDVINYRL